MPLSCSACCCSLRTVPAYRADTTPRERRRAASIVVPDRAAGFAERASISSAPRACAAAAAPSAPMPLSCSARCCSLRTAPAHPSRHDDGERAPSREHVVPDRAAGLAERAPISVVVLGVRRSGRTAERRPTPSSRSASLLLLHRTPRRLTRADTTTASARRAASTSFLDRAAGLAERAPSCRRARRAPLWPHRRAPTDAILTLSFVAAPPSHPAPAHPKPTRRRRARAEPRARRSLIAPPASSSARRSVSSPRACAALAAPPSADRRHPLGSASLLLLCVTAPAHPSRHDDARARAEPRARRSLIAPPASSSARRSSIVRLARAPSWPHRRAPTDAILSAQLRCCSSIAPRAGSPEPTRRPRERAPSREHVVP